MLSTDHIREIVRKIEYKDGWQFRVCDDSHLSRPRLFILADVPNSYQPSGTIGIGIRSVVPPCETPSQFLEWMLHRIIEAETHEVRELFKYDGVLVSDLHNETGGRVPGVTSVMAEPFSDGLDPREGTSPRTDARNRGRTRLPGGRSGAPIRGLAMALPLVTVAGVAGRTPHRPVAAPGSRALRRPGHWPVIVSRQRQAGENRRHWCRHAAGS